MYKLKTTGNDTHGISKEEFEKIKKLMNNGNGFVELQSGELINTSCIVSITEPKAEPYFMGNPMNPSMTKVQVGGEWKTFDQAHKDRIEMRKPTSKKLLK